MFDAASSLPVPAAMPAMAAVRTLQTQAGLPQRTPAEASVSGRSAQRRRVMAAPELLRLAQPRQLFGPHTICARQSAVRTTAAGTSICMT